MRSRLSLSLALLVFGSCSSDPEPNVDAGPSADATTSPDANETDAGLTNADAAAPADTGAASTGSSAWTLASPALDCTGTVTLCMDGGAVGGYQIAASGACPLASSMAVYLPGGSVPAAGTYTVRPAASIIDLANVPAGMAAVRIISYSTAPVAQLDWLGQSGTVEVTVDGGKISISTSGVEGKKAGSTDMSSMTISATCP